MSLLFINYIFLFILPALSCLTHKVLDFCQKLLYISDKFDPTMSQLTVQEINGAIISGGLTNEELNQVADALRYARARLVRVNKASLMLGDTVRFHSVKRGVTMQGTVNKIAIKYVTVATQQGLWRVPANMLEAV